MYIPYYGIDIEGCLRSPFSKLYRGIGKKLSLLENHIKSADRLYIKEFNEQIDDIQRTKLAASQKAKKEAEKEYEELIKQGEIYEKAIQIAQVDDDIVDFYEGLEKETKEYFDEIKDLNYKSFLVSLYSFLESELVRICKIDNLNSSTGYDYLKDCAAHLKKSIQKQERVKLIESYFSHFIPFEELRHKIVHASSTIDALPESLKKDRRILHDLDSKLFRIIDSNFLITFSKLIGDFFDDLHIMLEEKADFKFFNDSLICFFENWIYKEVIVKEINYKREPDSPKGQIIIHLKVKRSNSEAISLKIVIEKNSKVQKNNDFIDVYNSTNNEEMEYFKYVIDACKYDWRELIQATLDSRNKGMLTKIYEDEDSI